MPDTSQKPPLKRKWQLFQRRSVVVPTWRGWLMVLSVFLVGVFLVFRFIHPFLAPNHALPGGVLVIEGWAPDYAFAAAVEEFKSTNYQRLYVTGGPIERGAPLVEYKTYAELGQAILLKHGLTSNNVEAVSAPLVRKDRTYVSAVALKRWFQGNGIMPEKINVLTVGPHARRSWLMFRKAFGKQSHIGITAIPEIEYDSSKWWTSSQGVRSVVGEALAYGYARLFFYPKDN